MGKRAQARQLHGMNAATSSAYQPTPVAAFGRQQRMAGHRARLCLRVCSHTASPESRECTTLRCLTFDRTYSRMLGHRTQCRRLQLLDPTQRVVKGDAQPTPRSLVVCYKSVDMRLPRLPVPPVAPASQPCPPAAPRRANAGRPAWPRNGAGQRRVLVVMGKHHAGYGSLRHPLLVPAPTQQAGASPQARRAGAMQQTKNRGAGAGCQCRSSHAQRPPGMAASAPPSRPHARCSPAPKTPGGQPKSAVPPLHHHLQPVTEFRCCSDPS
jgi:hypothetical protein